MCPTKSFVAFLCSLCVVVSCGGDDGGDPEYYFRATVDGQRVSIVPSIGGMIIMGDSRTTHSGNGEGRTANLEAYFVHYLPDEYEVDPDGPGISIGIGRQHESDDGRFDRGSVRNLLRLGSFELGKPEEQEFTASVAFQPAGSHTYTTRLGPQPNSHFEIVALEFIDKVTPFGVRYGANTTIHFNVLLYDRRGKPAVTLEDGEMVAFFSGVVD